MRKSQTIRTKELILNLCLLVIVIFVALIFAEIILRLFFPQNLNITKADSNKIFEHKGGIKSILERNEFKTHVSISSQGLRDLEYSIDKAKNTTRIAFVGDSFIFGYGVEVEESITKLLEEKLNAKQISNRKYEVMNFGVSGYNTEQEYLLIKEKVLQYNPDLIILAYSPTDLKDNLRFNLFEIRNGDLVRNPPSTISIPTRIRNFLSWHSHLYSLAYFSISENSMLKNILVRSHVINEPISNPKKIDSLDYFVYSNNKSEELLYSINKTVLLLKDLDKNLNIPIALFFVPAKEQVDKNKLWEYSISAGINGWDLNSTKVQQVISGSLKDTDIAIMNPLPRFIKENSNNTFYYEIDGHWNQKGHLLASDFIYESLIKSSLSLKIDG